MTIDLPDEIVREAVPDDEIVLAYVTRGAMARYVEGVAAKNAAFREELLACIDGLEAAGEPVSAAAQAFRAPSAVVVPIRAAASAHAPASRISYRYVAALAAAAAFVLVAGAYHHDKVKAEETRAFEREKARELEETEAQLARLHEDMRRQQEAVAMAQQELATARSDAERSQAQAKLSAAQARQQETSTSVQAVKAGAKASGTKANKAACNCQPGDPLCSCL